MSTIALSLQPQQDASLDAAPTEPEATAESAPPAAEKAASQETLAVLTLPSSKYDAPAKPKKPIDNFPHRHYTTLHPVCNKLLALKWDNHQRDRLKTKLASSRSGLKEVPMFKMPANLKRIQLDKDRKLEIERHDVITQGRIKHILNTDMNRQSNSHDKPFIIRRQANATQMHKEKKIRLENEKKPLYTNIKWIEDRIIQVKYLTNISSFPQKYIDMGKELDLMLARAKKQSEERKNAPPVVRQKPQMVGKKPVKIVPVDRAPVSKNAAKKLPGIAQNEANAKIPRESSPVEATDQVAVSSLDASTPVESEESEALDEPAQGYVEDTHAPAPDQEAIVDTDAPAQDQNVIVNEDSAEQDQNIESVVADQEATVNVDSAAHDQGASESVIPDSNVYSDDEDHHDADDTNGPSENPFSRGPTVKHESDEPDLPGKEVEDVEA